MAVVHFQSKFLMIKTKSGDDPNRTHSSSRKSRKAKQLLIQAQVSFPLVLASLAPKLLPSESSSASVLF